jgi:hypothetical protein
VARYIFSSCSRNILLVCSLIHALKMTQNGEIFVVCTPTTLAKDLAFRWNTHQPGPVQKPPSSPANVYQRTLQTRLANYPLHTIALCLTPPTHDAAQHTANDLPAYLAAD